MSKHFSEEAHLKIQHITGCYGN